MSHDCRLYSYNILKSRESKFDDGSSKGGTKLCQQTADVIKNRPFVQLQVERNMLPPSSYPIEVAQKWLTLPGKSGVLHKFPLQTILPKVQMIRRVPARQLPRDVEVDRRRRQYAQIDLLALLREAGITDEDLLPSEEQYHLLSQYAFKHFLPIGFFDDSDFDCHSPEAWFKLGVIGNDHYPIPAKAYLPTAQSLKNYSWQYAAVSAYNEKDNHWTVMVLKDEQVYHVSKAQIMFLAENPHYFVKRLQKAILDRNRGESLILMENIVDCVLLQGLRERHKFKLKERIEHILNTCTTRTSYSFCRNLRTEVNLIYEHLMASYELDRFATAMPEEFPKFEGKLLYYLLPRAFKSVVGIKERSKTKALHLNIKERRHQVLQSTLFYSAGGLEAMEFVAEQCRYIETLTIFVTHFAKALPLSDFLQSQQQNSNNVCSYLRTFWPSKLSSGILLVLRPLGKGWLDISLDDWTIYGICKISRFLLQTKFRMQESMEVLLDKSIDNFSRLLIEPCKQFLDLSNDYTWPEDDFINTTFPFIKPIFSLVVGITEDEKVAYSTAPEDFEPSLLEIFKKALEKSAGVRHIDAETIANLRFAPNLFILTVELIEDKYVRINEVMQRCYRKAVIPLRAYAKLYERFIPFYLLNINKFFQDYAELKPSSQMVKNEILEQKRLKQELREILPATITIGPFLIIVDPIKQFMIRKRIEIVKRLFEYYVQRMYDINEKLLEQCVAVGSKISDRPQSIEHLYEIRDFALLVPERVEQLRGEIQIMWLEYEMLDGFFYNLSDQQFNMKWEVYSWPHNILQRLSTLREEQKNDIEEFRRLHMIEITSFEERLESLNDEIQAFSLQFDPNKVMETAVEVKKTWRLITDLQKLGNTLKYRQTLFELDELSLEFLESIVEGFVPYKVLWTACSDLIKLEEATVGNPLVNIDLDDAKQTVEEIDSALEESQQVFEDKIEIQEIATLYLEKLNEFKPVVDCIKWLRNEHWLHLHWQELNSRAGIEIKFSPAMNFSYCMRKGIMDHLNLVREISEKAEAEADEIRIAMEEEARRLEEERVALLKRREERKCRKDIL